MGAGVALDHWQVATTLAPAAVAKPWQVMKHGSTALHLPANGMRTLFHMETKPQSGEYLPPVAMEDAQASEC
jgi:hypothetical protein